MSIKRFTMRLGCNLGCVIALIAYASSALGQNILIGPSTRNGSFEEGTLDPWFGDFTVSENSSFASHGSWYGIIQDSLVFSPLTSQNLTPNPSAGLAFSLTFDARVGEPGYTSVSTAMGGRNLDGPVRADIIPLVAPPLSSSEWRSYDYRLEMPNGWDNAGVTFRISFSREAMDGVMRTAYLDNVVLTQIPEPSAFALLGLAGLVFAGKVVRRR